MKSLAAKISKACGYTQTSHWQQFVLFSHKPYLYTESSIRSLVVEDAVTVTVTKEFNEQFAYKVVPCNQQWINNIVQCKQKPTTTGKVGVVKGVGD